MKASQRTTPSGMQGVLVSASTTCSMKFSNIDINVAALVPVHTVTKEIVLDPGLAAAASTAFAIVPSNVNVGAPSSCSMKCLSLVTDITVFDGTLQRSDVFFNNIYSEVFSYNHGAMMLNPPWPLPVQGELAIMRPTLWPYFNMDSGSSRNMEFLWLWKPPWSYLPWENILCLSAIALMAFIKGITVISVSVGSIVELHMLAGLISGADQLYIQSSRDVVVILLCWTQFLEHRMVLSIVKGAFMLKLLTVFGISSVDCLLLEHREMINHIVLQQLRFFEDKQKNGLAILFCYFQGRTQIASGFIIIWLAGMHTEEWPDATGSYNIQEVICLMSYDRFMEFNISGSSMGFLGLKTSITSSESAVGTALNILNPKSMHYY